MTATNTILRVEPRGFLSVAIRAEKKRDSEKLGSVKTGQLVRLLEAGDGDDWWRIKKLPDGPEGFLPKRFLSAVVRPKPPEEIELEAFTSTVALYSRTYAANSILLIAIARLGSDIKNNIEPDTGRVGPFRFDKATWNDLVGKHPEIGILEEEIDDWRCQATLAPLAFSHYAQAIQQALDKAATSLQLYATHILGMDAAIPLLKNPDDTRSIEDVLEAAGSTKKLIKRAIQLAPDDTEKGKKQVNRFFEDLANELAESIQEIYSLLKIEAIGGNLGSLSVRYESNGDPAARGFDSNGGFSYGLYQLSSNKGQVGEFIRFLAAQSELIDFANALNIAGGEKAAKFDSNVFLDAWKEAAADSKFNTAQHSFIKASHYDPLAKRLEQTEILPNAGTRSRALQDVIWSVAVQHGVSGGFNLFSKALENLDTDERKDDKAVITSLYRERRILEKYFKKSQQLHVSLRRRFISEENEALAMFA